MKIFVTVTYSSFHFKQPIFIMVKTLSIVEIKVCVKRDACLYILHLYSIILRHITGAEAIFHVNVGNLFC